jgi:hypothetical protein
MYANMTAVNTAVTTAVKKDKSLSIINIPEAQPAYRAQLTRTLRLASMNVVAAATKTPPALPAGLKKLV